MTATAKKDQALAEAGYEIPTTVHAHMQSIGLLNDHIDGCCVREAVEQQQVEAARRLHVSPDSAAERDWSARQGL